MTYLLAIVVVVPSVLFLSSLGAIMLSVKWLALADPAVGEPRRLRGA